MHCGVTPAKEQEYRMAVNVPAIVFLRKEKFVFRSAGQR